MGSPVSRAGRRARRAAMGRATTVSGSSPCRSEGVPSTARPRRSALRGRLAAAVAIATCAVLVWSTTSDAFSTHGGVQPHSVSSLIGYLIGAVIVLFLMALVLRFTWGWLTGSDSTTGDDDELGGRRSPGDEERRRS